MKKQRNDPDLDAFDRSFDLRIRPHRITDRRTLASGYVDRYDYLGGAHGTSTYEAINFGPKGRIRLRDLFRPGQDAVGQSSRAILAVLKSGDSDEVPSNVKLGRWTRLTKEGTDRFVVGPKGVLFLFDQYDLGVGAEGPRTVLVPFSKLPGIDRKGVLKTVLP